MERYFATVASAERYAHAEGPIAGDGDRVLWVDIPNGDVFEAEVDYKNGVFQLTGARLFSHVDGTVGAVLLGRDPANTLDDFPEVAFAAGTRMLFRSRSGSIRSIVPLCGVSPKTVRFNDAKVDPFGQIVAGTMAFDAAPDAGGLYRMDSEGRIETLLTHATISNGLAWSLDGASMYYIDSAHPVVDVFDYAQNGSLQNRRQFASIPSSTGTPDGMCIDSHGFIWVAIWGGSQVQCFLPDGDLFAIIEVDAPNVSSCAFVGANRDLLLITTSRQGLSEDQIRLNPNAGALFLVDVNVVGQPQARFGITLF